MQALANVNKETLAFIIGGCICLLSSASLPEPYRGVAFVTGIVMIPLAFIWNYLDYQRENHRLQTQLTLIQNQLESFKIKCPECAALVIPRKVGAMILCPSCNHEFRSPEQWLGLVKHGTDALSSLFGLLGSLAPQPVKKPDHTTSPAR